jgi:hypothetical protein
MAALRFSHFLENALVNRVSLRICIPIVRFWRSMCDVPGARGSPFRWANLGLLHSEQGRALGPAHLSCDVRRPRPNLPRPRLASKRRTRTGAPDGPSFWWMVICWADFRFTCDMDFTTAILISCQVRRKLVGRDEGYLAISACKFIAPEYLCMRSRRLSSVGWAAGYRGCG